MFIDRRMMHVSGPCLHQAKTAANVDMAFLGKTPLVCSREDCDTKHSDLNWMTLTTRGARA